MAEILPISFCTFVKNEEKHIRDCIESVRPVVAEIVVVDTGSTDSTVEICQEFTDRIYKVGFSDFGSIRTLTAHLALYPWVLMLDADERLEGADWPLLAKCIDQPQGTQGDDMEMDEDGEVVIDSWALPRKRWADIWMHKQVEVEAYPDWQVRLFRNYVDRPKIQYRRRVHETIIGCVKTEYAHEGPTIHHFQNVYKEAVDLQHRQDMYERLRTEDVSTGISHSAPAVVGMDCVVGDTDEDNGNS